MPILPLSASFESTTRNNILDFNRIIDTRGGSVDGSSRSPIVHSCLVICYVDIEALLFAVQSKTVYGTCVRIISSNFVLNNILKEVGQRFTPPPPQFLNVEARSHCFES